MSTRFAFRRMPASKLELAIIAASLLWGALLEIKDTLPLLLAKLRASWLWRWLRRAMLVGGGYAFLAALDLIPS
jgi:hypothetical protein